RAPADMQGRSLVPLLAGRTPPDWRSSFYYEYYEYPQPHHVRPHHGVVTSRYKLVRFDRPDVDTWGLFDREQDPRELPNVHGDPAHRGGRAGRGGVGGEGRGGAGRRGSGRGAPAAPPAGAWGRARAGRRP